MPDPRQVVEHLTIAGFIRRSPHRFHMDEITRFGDKVARLAEALQVSYLTTIDRSLGMVRVFPVPLLQRVYDVMAAQFGWEMEIAAVEDRKTRGHERTKRVLLEAAASAEDPIIRDALAVVLRWLETQGAGASPIPPPPRVVK